MTGKTVLSFQEWEAQSGMNMEPQGAEMGMQAEPMMPSEEVPSHEPVQPGMEIMPVEEPGDLSKMDEPEQPEEQDENDPMMMDYK
jgi:hypothetical protein